MTTAQADTGGATYRVLRELGARAQHTHAAIREPSELVVVQRFVRTPTHGGKPASDATPVTAEAMALLLRDARCLAKNWHPNVARVRHVDLVGAELFVATELVDGVTLGDLLQAAAAQRTNVRDPVLALPLLVRILVDVLGGLHGLHGLRDATNMSLDAIHGELCPSNIVVGKDGVARLVAVFRPRPVKIAAGSEALGYAAPEALDAGGTGDVRADLYAVGVMLWEALTGRRLWGETDPARIRARQREEELVRPELPDASPFVRLADVAMRALSFDPALRHKSASEMATELRRIAGTRIAPGSAVAQKVAELAGDRIRSRRADLDPSMRRRAESLPPPEENDDPLHADEATFMGLAIAAEKNQTPLAAKVDAPKAPGSSPKPPPSAPKALDSSPKPPASSPSVAKDAKKDEPSKPGAPRPGPAAPPTKPAGFAPFDLLKPGPKLVVDDEDDKPKPEVKEAPKTPVEKAVAIAAPNVADVKIAVADAPPASPFALSPSVAPPGEKPAAPPPPAVVPPPPPFALAPSLAPPVDKPAEAKPAEETKPTTNGEDRPSPEPHSVDHVHVAAVPAEALPADAADDAPVAPPRRRNLVPIVGAVVGLAVVVLVGGLLAMNRSHDGDAKTPEPAKTAVATPPAVETATATPPPTATVASTAPVETATPPEPSATVAAEPATPPETKPAPPPAEAKTEPKTPVVRPATPPPPSPPVGRPPVKKKKTYDPSGI